MSYILDALKRADAERERGSAPGLHSQHQLPSGSTGSPSPSRALWLILAGVVALLLMAAGIWLWRVPDSPPPVANQAAVQPLPGPVAPTAPTAASAPPVTPPPTPAVPAQETEAPVTQARPMAKPAQLKAAEAPAFKPATAVSTTITKVSPPAVPAEAVVAVPGPAAPAGNPAATRASPVASTTATAPAATPLLSELPQDLRSLIPGITITGSVYSDSPAQRLLVVNNLVLAQGSHVTPDLMLEEIQPRSSVFSFKGTRFRVMH